MAVDFLFVHINKWALPESPDSIPLSQAYILASLQQEGFTGRILGDYKDTPLSPVQFRLALLANKPRVLGFSVYEENINRVRVLSRFAKSIDPDILIVVGGPQITFMPAEGLRQMDEVDVLCRGEGETTMLALAHALKNGAPLSMVPGLCFFENGAAVETKAVPGPQNLDDLPSPYLTNVLRPFGRKRMILLSSRGCSSPCTFCYTTRATRGRIRFHYIDRMIAEMQHLQTQGINDFWFADPNFAYSRERLELLMEAIIDQVPKASLWCQTRYNLVDRKLLDLLKKAGVHTIAFGLESVDPAVLKKIKKGLEPEKLSQAVRLTQEAGIEAELFTLFGLPGESLAQAKKTLHFVKNNKVEVSGNSISQQLQLFFGTPITDDPSRHGISPLPMTKPAYLSVCRDYETEGMGADEIRRMSMLWRLHRSDFEENVAAGKDLFNIAGFITSHEDNLFDEPFADLLLARIFMRLDEYEQAAACLQRLRSREDLTPALSALAAGPFTAYKIKRRSVARQGCRIIYDCRAMYDNKVLPATEGYYQDVVLGEGRLLADFEQGVLGVRAGGVTQFHLRFPDGYGNTELAGLQVVFQVFLHQVLEPLYIENVDEMAAHPPRTVFRFQDLEALRAHNENLYYLVLRDTTLHGLIGDLKNLLSFMNLNLRLGFREKALELAGMLPSDPAIQGHAGRIFFANSMFPEALDFFARADDDSETMIKTTKALIGLQRYEEAENLVALPELDGNTEALDLRVGLASLRGLPVHTYLERMNALLNLQVAAMQREGGISGSFFSLDGRNRPQSHEPDDQRRPACVRAALMPVESR